MGLHSIGNFTRKCYNHAKTVLGGALSIFAPFPPNPVSSWNKNCMYIEVLKNSQCDILQAKIDDVILECQKFDMSSFT